VATNIKIEWNPPATDNSYTIDAYMILIKNADGDYVESSYCDGSDATIMAAEECFIPMSAFWVDPFNLESGDLIEI